MEIRNVDMVKLGPVNVNPQSSRVRIPDLIAKKAQHRKITMLTAYEMPK